ncbi:glycosyltransferase [Chelatococcus reniformis]|uniref:Glycosyl transferase n=1 Tax=Chelatococcus reniformis TaxID=1494448 RepID=A0A916UBK3_9HYPH|nr:glycosyltransferase [Chelatococcus reniformis]GGC67670.1 glycosyl transferase [Chelatococcus reniformis]
MNVLFVHNNFPAQFRHVAPALAKIAGVRVAAIGTWTARDVEGVRLERYRAEGPSSQAHTFARRFDAECRRAEEVIYAATKLRSSGFEPDVIVGHSGWGETIPLREMFPRARIVVYSEFYYRSRGLDVGFDPEFPSYGVDGMVGLNARNASQLLALADADIGISPTQWQRSTYPPELQAKIQVIHEGIDTAIVAPNPGATFELASGRRLTRDDEVVTFVARALEPLRGFHVFMRALPEIQRAQPKAEIVIVGDTVTPYGLRARGGRSWKEVFLGEVEGRLDMSRIHFVGHLAYEHYLSLLQISSAHVYLTYPFVVSWSLLEAMSACCAVIGSDTPPVREIVRGGEGLLVPFFEPSAIAAQVVAVLEKGQAFDGMRQRARQRILDGYDKATVCVPRLMSLLTRL